MRVGCLLLDGNRFYQHFIKFSERGTLGKTGGGFYR